MKLKTRSLLLPLTAFALALAAPLAAQAPVQAPATAPAAAADNFSATIAGTVAVDGLAVPGAIVTVTDPASGKSFVTSTDESGRFTARAAHAGEYDISAAMPAFATADSKITVPAAGGQLPSVGINLVLASRAPAPTAAAPTPTTAATNTPAKPAATTPTTTQTASNGASGRGGANATGRSRNGRGGNSSGNDLSGFQTLDISQTGDLSAAGADAGNPQIAGMNDNAATDSDVVSGTASQDDNPMSGQNMQAFLGGGPGGGGPGGGGPGGGPGGGGRGGPGGGGPGGGGFGGGGRGGFGGGPGGGGRGGFNFRGASNRFNQPHGNLSYSLSDSALNALPDSLTGSTATTNPPNAANQNYTATVTTPFKIPHIYDDHGHTNLTFSWRGRHNSGLSDDNGLVPTVLERGGDFQGLTDRNGNPITITNPATGQAYTNNTIPTCPAGDSTAQCSAAGDISPAAAALLAYIPKPTPGAVGTYNYTNTVNSLSSDNTISLRLNHSFGNTAGGGGFGGRGGGRGRSISFNLSYQGGHGFTPGTFYPFEESFNNSRGMNMSLSYNQPIAGWIDNFSINYNRNRTNLYSEYSGNTNVAAAAGITGVSTNPLDWGLPNLSFATSGLTGLNGTSPNYVRSQTFSLSDSVVRRIKKHNIRFGGDMRWLQNNPENDQIPNGAFSFDGQYSGYDFADFLLGDAQQTSEKFGGGVFYFRQAEPDLYFNDNWQMRGNLTINYGIRWEYISPYTEIYNRITNLEIGPNFSSVTPVVAGQNGVSDSVIQPDYHHFRPSIGFAYKTVANALLMGSFGMAYNTGAYANVAEALAYESPFLTTQTNLGTTSTPLSLSNGFSGTNGVVNTYGVNPNYTVGYSYLWNLDVQRQVGKDYLVNLDYSGSRGEHLDQLLAPNRTATGLLYPNLQPFLYDTTGGQSLYNGGSVIVSRRLSHSVSFRARYTYSKMEDDASQIGGGGGPHGLIAQNPLDLAAEWALSSGNVTHRLNLTYEWQLPYGLNHRWGDNSSIWNSAFGDWQFSGTFTANSGQPFSPTVANVNANAQGLQALGVNAPLRANFTGTSTTVATPTLAEFFNPAAFSAPAAGTYGDAGRDTIIGPGQAVLGLSLSKTFRISEFKNFEIQFNGNNVLNHANWSGINTTFGTPTFGSVTGFGTMRAINFTARYRF